MINGSEASRYDIVVYQKSVIKARLNSCDIRIAMFMDNTV